MILATLLWKANKFLKYSTRIVCPVGTNSFRQSPKVFNLYTQTPVKISAWLDQNEFYVKMLKRGHAILEVEEVQHGDFQVSF